MEQKEEWTDGHYWACNHDRFADFYDGRQTIAEMRAKTRKLIHQFSEQKPIIMIDYLSLIRPNQDYGGNMHLQVTEISRELKMLAK